jgi:nicotinate-nucleotide--dimethylbenzimidazole phosphoribosyltransferase
VTALLEIGADVEWTDGVAAASARAAVRPGSGRLADLVEWLAATQGAFPPARPQRIRCLVLGPVDDAVAELAASLDVGLRPVEEGSDPAEALAAGIAAADHEIEAGADLLILAAVDAGSAAATAMAILTDAEPVALLPRGAEAVDTSSWIARAVELRDERRRIRPLRSRPDELMAALGSPVLAAAAGIALRAASRRTPVVLDGTAAVVAGLLCVDLQSRARRWWQVADTSSDPVHARAVEEFGQRPVLDLATGSGSGLAGLLAVTVLRAAAASA